MDQDVANTEDTIYNLQESLEKVHEFARSHLKLASDRMKWQYDTHGEEVAFQCGDPVWLYCPVWKKGISPKLSRPCLLNRPDRLQH